MQGGSFKKLEYVFQQLEKRITSGYWKVGDRILNETELAAEFDCSRGTVSKAVGRLVHEGLVERRTKVGTRVIRNVTQRTSAPSLQLDACAFILPSDKHEGIWRIMRGFQEAAHEVKRRTLILSTGTDLRKEAEIIGRLSEFDVKGAVIYPVIVDPRDQVYFMQMILASQFPVVLVELNLPGVGHPSVVADGLHAGYTVTKHLLSQGLERIGFLTNYAWVPFVRDRYLGYRQALEEAGVPENPKYIQLESGMHPRFEDPLQEPTRLAKAYLESHRDLQGIVCGNDFFAHGCLVAAEELGIKVPDQLKVIGIDDFGSLPHSSRLTTYHIPYEEMGRTAFQNLERCFQEPTFSATEQQLRGHLVIRKSA